MGAVATGATGAAAGVAAADASRLCKYKHSYIMCNNNILIIHPRDKQKNITHP